jgi:DNA-binding LacI/PurR family transcriptional regulator
MRQLAQAAGVSIATISLALRNHPSIPAATRERIQALAETLGYRSDPVVASLMAQLRTTRADRPPEKLALLTFWPSPDGWRRNVNTHQYFEGATTRARQLGYEIEHFWAKDPAIAQNRLSRILYNRGIRGVLTTPLIQARGHISLEWEHFACVAVGYTVIQKLPRVAHAHFNGMQLLLRKLRQRGYRRIGYVSPESEANRVNRLWLGSYLAFSHDATPLPPLLQPQPEPKELAAWLRRHRPDCVVSNVRDYRVLLEELGYDLPGDLGFASPDVGDRTIAGIDQFPSQVGATAVDVVTSLLQHNQFGLPRHPTLHLVDGVWRDGPTIRRAGG